MEVIKMDTNKEILLFQQLIIINQITICNNIVLLDIKIIIK